MQKCHNNNDCHHGCNFKNSDVLPFQVDLIFPRQSPENSINNSKSKIQNGEDWDSYLVNSFGSFSKLNSTGSGPPCSKRHSKQGVKSIKTEGVLRLKTVISKKFLIICE